MTSPLQRGVGFNRDNYSEAPLTCIQSLQRAQNVDPTSPFDGAEGYTQRQPLMSELRWLIYIPSMQVRQEYALRLDVLLTKQYYSCFVTRGQLQNFYAILHDLPITKVVVKNHLPVTKFHYTIIKREVGHMILPVVPIVSIQIYLQKYPSLHSYRPFLPQINNFKPANQSSTTISLSLFQKSDRRTWRALNFNYVPLPVVHN